MQDSVVSAHYNARAQPVLAERRYSPILQVKNFNNWVKAVLIRKALRLADESLSAADGEEASAARFGKQGPAVLDLAGGKGADLIKYAQAGASFYVCADLAAVSVQHGLERYNQALIQQQQQRSSSSSLSSTGSISSSSSSAGTKRTFGDTVAASSLVSVESQRGSHSHSYRGRGHNFRGGRGGGNRSRPTVRFPAVFAAGDNFKAGFVKRVLQKLLEQQPKFRSCVGEGQEFPTFDLCSIQFALHYSFESEERARGLLENVSQALRPGGRFIGTIPNAYLIVRRIREALAAQDASPEFQADERSRGTVSFGNRHYTVRFNRNDAVEFPAFGARYAFTLQDAVDDVPEFLVHFPTLERLAKEYDLELDFKFPFHQFFEEMTKHDIERDENAALLQRIRVLDDRGTISPEQWEAIGFYMTFCFRKCGVAGRHVVPYPDPDVVPLDQIIDFSES